ncbi:RNA polymerase sigma factor [Actinokineospora sp. 24-640]
MDAEVVAQEAWLRTLGKWDAISNRRGYLFRVAQRVAIDSLKLARKHVPLESAGDVVETRAADPLLACEVRELVKAIALLPEAQQEVMHLVVGELDVREIAAVLGKSEAAVRKSMRRAKAELARQGFGEPPQRRAPRRSRPAADPAPEHSAKNDSQPHDICGIGARDA